MRAIPALGRRLDRSIHSTKALATVAMIRPSRRTITVDIDIKLYHLHPLD
jgi:hypothetical protein